MKKLYNIKSYDERGKQIEFAQFIWDGSYSHLEEVLYILHEIEPKDRHWIEAMDSINCATFTYHRIYDSMVIIDYDKELIKVIDIA